MTDARVNLWGREIGAVSWLDDREISVFQYAPEFSESGIEVAPLMMPLRDTPYEFPGLPRDTFKGFPGLLADSLPTNSAMRSSTPGSQGRSPETFNPVERLCYIGARGMGALEFEPAILGSPTRNKKLEVAALVDLANRVLIDRKALTGTLEGTHDRKRLKTSFASERRPAARGPKQSSPGTKAAEFRSGQITAGEGFTYWLMKFDGVSDNRDREFADPQGSASSNTPII